MNDVEWSRHGTTRGIISWSKCNANDFKTMQRKEEKKMQDKAQYITTSLSEKEFEQGDREDAVFLTLVLRRIPRGPCHEDDNDNDNNNKSNQEEGQEEEGCRQGQGGGEGRSGEDRYRRARACCCAKEPPCPLHHLLRMQVQGFNPHPLQTNDPPYFRKI
eukprot:757153-Hanusia_phi.AAC.2